MGGDKRNEKNLLRLKNDEGNYNEHDEAGEQDLSQEGLDQSRH